MAKIFHNVIGLLLSALVLVAMYLAANASSGRFTEMVFERGLIPHVILVAAAFGIGLLLGTLIHNWKSYRNQKKLAAFVDESIDAILAFVRPGQDAGDADDVADELFAPLPPGRERERVVGLLRDCREASRDFALKRLQMSMDLEHQAAENAFRVPQVLAWTVPMLGFLGTVWGIGISLGNFTGVLGDVDNISQIKEGLGTITAGLSIAFDTTLLGLFFAIVITGLSTFVQRRETACLSRLERTALELLKTLSAHDTLTIADTEDARTALTTAASQLREAFSSFQQRIEELHKVAEKQSADLVDERKALQHAADSFRSASGDLRQIAQVLQAPREYRFVETQTSAERSDGE